MPTRLPPAAQGKFYSPPNPSPAPAPYPYPYGFRFAKGLGFARHEVLTPLGPLPQGAKAPKGLGAGAGVRGKRKIGGKGKGLALPTPNGAQKVGCKG
jgi:hypothetical protein